MSMYSRTSRFSRAAHREDPGVVAKRDSGISILAKVQFEKVAVLAEAQQVVRRAAEENVHVLQARTNLERLTCVARLVNREVGKDRGMPMVVARVAVRRIIGARSILPSLEEA